ncbi:hypothetical protein FB45DRAFT_846796 [Roridomyces roridus]|uniref:Ras GEF n=1 Tax=Roridomyces roridus TaxID=1738132 RepID=A0AAD7B1G3_9AGAR|nr:hypothetical protein FB45DRAFT_846796 [Roridomyces roridus]
MSAALPIPAPDTPPASRLSFSPSSPPGLSTSPEPSTSAFSSTSSIQSPASSSDSHGSRVLLPIPTTASDNSSQASFAFSEVDIDGTPLDPLPPEIAAADISIAPDGSFVETSSGPAARELKRRYDHHYGVGVNVRSPYAITAFINQHGRQMYRVGKREKKTPPAASAVEPDSRERASTSVSSSSDSRANSPPRKSRLSVSVAMFSRPQTSTGGSGPRNKLRKTRSFSEMGTASTSMPPAVRPPGRGHSQSVTSADFMSSSVGESMLRSGDIFAGVMGWYPSAPSGTSLSSSHSHLPRPSGEASSSAPTELSQPFGPTILFESPASKPKIEFLPTPRLLREMQSFESGLTARPEDHRDDEDSLDGHSLTRPRSALRLRDSTVSSASFFSDLSGPAASIAESPLDSAVDSPELPKELPAGPILETAIHSRYSTDVFDVLQTYRGLPLLERLAAGEETKVIKMSLSADNTAAPKDDPRFVIWGEAIPESQQHRDTDEDSQSQSHHTDGSASSLSKKRGNKGKNGSNGEVAPLPVLKLSLDEAGNPTGAPTQKILVAATIERWIAQLTSDLSYDELLNFFLTYRTYISGVDLCHLLICRFHWALQQPKSPQDEVVRRVVRVRTFVAIRYWLLTFFSVDFLPDRELRLLVAGWLNTLVADPILKKSGDGLSIVRKLKKVAKDCKRVHTRVPPKPKEPRPSSVKVEQQQAEAGQPQPHVLGEQFAAATRKPRDEDEDSDVDLDFRVGEGKVPDSPSDFAGDLANAHLSTVHLGSSTRAMPISSLSILERTETQVADPGPVTPFVQSPATLPIHHHNSLSRAFVNTIGRLGRWKRVLNQRSGGGLRAPSGIDLELTVGRDLLSVNGGVQQYLKMIEPATAPSIPSVAPSPSPAPTAPDPAVSLSPVLSTISSLPADDVPTGDVTAASESEAHEVASLAPSSFVRPGSVDRASSFRSSSTDSFGAPLAPGLATFGGAQTQWQFEVMSIDELDLSDNSSDEGPSVPPGLRQPVRRLPLRREFEFVRRSESVSSLGQRSAHSSVASSVSATPDEPMQLAQWQMDALVESFMSDEEETGDVEAALNRLEGQINPEKQQEKASKVDLWIRTIRQRHAVGDYVDRERRFSDDEEEEEEEEDYDEPHSNDDPDAAREPHDITIVEPGEDPTPINPHSAHPPRPADDAKPAPEDAVPLEILQSRMPAVPSPAIRPQVTKFVPPPETTRFYRSFIFGHRAQVLAEHFAMIDRELFMAVKFEEVLSDWQADEDVEVLDWGQFVKDRARWKLDPEWGDKISALGSVRARFNLLTKFVVTEVVLSPPNERPAVVAKFIRIAWNSYLLSSFNMLVAIITGLRSPYVSQALKTWRSVGRWEIRVFNDLKVYVTSADDFKYIRQAIADTKSQDASGANGSETDVRASKHKSINEYKPASACVPFIGVYLAQLYRHNKLPDLIDPTAPTVAVGIDPVTSNFDAPSHPEVFSALAPLPPSMHLEPLINVHKQRLIARVIKSMVAGQHLASRVHYPVERRLFQKCLRIRGLDAETLERALSMYP